MLPFVLFIYCFFSLMFATFFLLLGIIENTTIDGNNNKLSTGIMRNSEMKNIMLHVNEIDST